MTSNPAIALRLQSNALVGRVAELGSLAFSNTSAMSDEVFGLVSQWGALPHNDELNGISIIACSTVDTNRIAIADGWSPHDHGSVLSAAELLTRQWYRESLNDGRVIFEKEPPGWFERRCALLKCSWFSPLARRMAAGEVVPFDEMREAYRAHNDGRDMPMGKWWQLRETCEIGSQTDENA